MKRGAGWQSEFAEIAMRFPEQMRSFLSTTFIEWWEHRNAPRFDTFQGKLPEFKFELIGLDIGYLREAVA